MTASRHRQLSVKTATENSISFEVVALRAQNVGGRLKNGASHGFHNDTTPRYDEAAATLAWSRTLQWFEKYLTV